MEIAERLRTTREDLDMTQKYVALNIDCSREQINRYENGKQEMTISKLRKICLLYDVSADYILGLPKNMKWPR